MSLSLLDTYCAFDVQRTSRKTSTGHMIQDSRVWKPICHLEIAATRHYCSYRSNAIGPSRTRISHCSLSPKSQPSRLFLLPVCADSSLPSLSCATSSSFAQHVRAMPVALRLETRGRLCLSCSTIYCVRSKKTPPVSIDSLKLGTHLPSTSKPTHKYPRILMSPFCLSLL